MARRDIALYVIAAVSYIAIGIAWKPLLNWIIGPLWLVAVVAIDDRLRRRRQPAGR